MEKVEVVKEIPNYEVGDKVKLLDNNDFGIVYKTIDKFNKVAVLYKDEFIDVNVRRMTIEFKSKEFIPRWI